MNRTFCDAEIAAVFEKMGVSPIQRGAEQVHRLMRDAQGGGGERVVYRTVLTNGTGRLPAKGEQDAQLEPNSYRVAG